MPCYYLLTSNSFTAEIGFRVASEMRLNPFLIKTTTLFCKQVHMFNSFIILNIIFKNCWNAEVRRTHPTKVFLFPFIILNTFLDLALGLVIVANIAWAAVTVLILVFINKHGDGGRCCKKGNLCSVCAWFSIIVMFLFFIQVSWKLHQPLTSNDL